MDYEMQFFFGRGFAEVKILKKVKLAEWTRWNILMTVRILIDIDKI